MTRTPHQAALADILPLIESLELPYLESLQQLLGEHIDKRRRERITEARAKIMQIALRVGLTPEQLVQGHLHRPHAGTGQAKYRDPDTGKTWSGLGTVPRWIKGKDRIAFLIEHQA